MSPPAAPAYLDPLPGSRRLLLLWLLSGGTVLFALRVWLEPLGFQWLAQQPPCLQLVWLERMTWVLVTLLLLPVALLWRQATRIARAGQFPVSGRWLWRRTPISRGAPVATLVSVLRVLAVLLLLAMLLTLVALLVYQPFLAPTHLACPP